MKTFKWKIYLKEYLSDGEFWWTELPERFESRVEAVNFYKDTYQKLGEYYGVLFSKDFNDNSVD